MDTHLNTLDGKLVSLLPRPWRPGRWRRQPPFTFEEIYDEDLASFLPSNNEADEQTLLDKKAPKPELEKEEGQPMREMRAKWRKPHKPHAWRCDGKHHDRGTSPCLQCSGSLELPAATEVI